MMFKDIVWKPWPGNSHYDASQPLTYQGNRIRILRSNTPEQTSLEAGLHDVHHTTIDKSGFEWAGHAVIRNLDVVDLAAAVLPHCTPWSEP